MKEIIDGQMIKDAIHAFYEEQTEQRLIRLLQLLCDSEVIVPCTAIIGDADKEFFEDMLDEADGDLDTFAENIVGKTYTNKDQIRLVPDILQNGDDFFFPVFTSIDDMGEYGEQFSTVPAEFVFTITLARNNEKDVKGIVVNAFSEPFVLDRELFDVIENMKK